jgi:hypothetical protein
MKPACGSRQPDPEFESNFLIPARTQTAWRTRWIRGSNTSIRASITQDGRGQWLAVDADRGIAGIVVLGSGRALPGHRFGKNRSCKTETVDAHGRLAEADSTAGALPDTLSQNLCHLASFHLVGFGGHPVQEFLHDLSIGLSHSNSLGQLCRIRTLVGKRGRDHR